MAEETKQLQAVYSTKDVADVLSVQESTVRKYASLLEDFGYSYLKNEHGHRAFFDRDLIVLRKMLGLKSDADMTLEEAAKSVVAWNKGNDIAVSDTGEKLHSACYSDLIEANEKKYSFVWAKAVNNYDKKLKEKIAALLEEVKAVTTEEMATMTLEEQLEQTTDSLQQEVIELEKAMEQEVDKEQKKALRQEKSEKKKHVKAIHEDYLPRLEKHEQHRQVLGERNSYSKTDTDATFMRMKDDHMKNGQLKEAYNIQISTQNQYIVGFELFQRPGDTRCFQPFMEKLLAKNLRVPEVVVADAGYASEQNYLYALGEEKAEQTENLRFQLVSPYNTYLKEKKHSFKNEKKNVKNWTYVEEDDYFICPNEQRVVFKKYQKKKSKDGFIQDFKIYECEDCSGCPFKSEWTKAKGNRQVH